MPERISGFRGELLWEWDIAERQLLQLANTFEAGDYEWRPDTSARGVSEAGPCCLRYVHRFSNGLVRGGTRGE
jgi:hypothetical protein